MKLILANNQSEKFRDFYESLRTRTKEPFDYSGYTSLLFELGGGPQPMRVINLATGKKLSDYSGVYINSYLNSYELAAATAIACEYLKLPFINTELADPPSLSKLTMYAKLAAAGVRLPPTIAGTKAALLAAEKDRQALGLPAVLKRADADRGVDNYLVKSDAEVFKHLDSHKDRSLWLLQQFIPNDGFYLVSFYDQQPVFSIYRTLETRPDGNDSKAHMFKPKGGANARLMKIKEVPLAVIQESQRAVAAMKRQVASVDCIYDEASGHAYILEVNYNPQIVTIETFKDERLRAFTDFLDKKW